MGKMLETTQCCHLKLLWKQCGVVDVPCRGGSQIPSKLVVLSSSPYICPAGELLAERRVQHDQWDRGGDVATVYVPNIHGILQP